MSQFLMFWDVNYDVGGVVSAKQSKVIAAQNFNISLF